MRRSLIGTLLLACLTGSAGAADGWQAGFARVVITPDEGMCLSGYAGRNTPADGKIHDLYARAAALKDPQGATVVIVGMDVIGVPATMAAHVAQAVEEKHGLPRGRLMLTCSHTHCGPALDDGLTKILFLSPEEAAKIPKYQAQLNAKVIGVIGAALADLKPALLATGLGKTEFATNRRAPIGTGPIDQEVPVLRVLSPDGKQLRGVVFGYACHNTTMSFTKYCGDYAGFACLDLEGRHPDAVALFWLGCGGDQNPLPRRKIELCEKYGRMLALAVESVMAGNMENVSGPLRTEFERVELDFSKVPTQAELETMTRSDNKYVVALGQRLLDQLARNEPLAKSYPYPVQVWRLGDKVTWVALGGEIVVDYSLRIKRELGPGRTWVTGYANDVMAYIPSERVLEEGGYEGDTSNIYYQIPTKWAVGLEDKIVQRVNELAKRP